MKILVVEDDRKVAGFIEQGLREEGYVVDVAPDGDQGTMLAHVYDYDLLVLDVMLPKKTGLQVAAELRREGRATPILMLTARDATEDVVRGLDAGADDYLTKPFKFDELLARVRALVRRGGAGGSVRASLRRTLALRFAATMAVGLLLATGAFYWSASRALQESVSPAALRSDLLLVLVSIVVAGTAATLMGAWHFTSSAVRPVAEITAQATCIEAGTLDQRILAHADTEEYEGLVAVLNRMLERLERGFAAQRRLTADVSHELRTPLTALRGEIEVALRAPRSQREYERVLRSGLEEIERLTELSEDLLLVTRAEARLVSARRVPTHFERLVADRLERLRRRFEERDLAVEPSLRAARSGVLIDPELIGRLVDHLLENALQFTPLGGTIRVQLEPMPAGGGQF